MEEGGGKYQPVSEAPAKKNNGGFHGRRGKRKFTRNAWTGSKPKTSSMVRAPVNDASITTRTPTPRLSMNDSVSSYGNQSNNTRIESDYTGNQSYASSILSIDSRTISSYTIVSASKTTDMTITRAMYSHRTSSRKQKSSNRSRLPKRHRSRSLQRHRSRSPQTHRSRSFQRHRSR